MYDSNPLVHQLHLRDVERSARSATGYSASGARTGLPRAAAVVFAAAVILGVVLIGGQAAALAAALT